MNTWPAQLRAAREAAGLTQRQLAERLCVSQPTVADYEAAGANLTEETVRRYARAIGLTVELVLKKAKKGARRWAIRR